MFWHPSKNIKIGLRKTLNNSTDVQQSFIQILQFYKKKKFRKIIQKQSIT